MKKAPPPSPSTQPGPEADPVEIAAYVSQMAGELAELSRSAKLGAIAYLLDMAKDEAANEAGKPPKI
jgi:hypothetical protein